MVYVLKGPQVAPMNEVFKQGYKAFTAGVMDNPYAEYLMVHREWQRGFNKAYTDNLEVLNATT
jgi:hypothetical protein